MFTYGLPSHGDCEGRDCFPTLNCKYYVYERVTRRWLVVASWWFRENICSFVSRWGNLLFPFLSCVSSGHLIGMSLLLLFSLYNTHIWVVSLSEIQNISPNLAPQIILDDPHISALGDIFCTIVAIGQYGSSLPIGGLKNWGRNPSTPGVLVKMVPLQSHVNVKETIALNSTDGWHVGYLWSSLMNK